MVKERWDGENFVIDKCFSLMADLRKAKEDIGVEELAFFFDISSKDLKKILSNEKKFFVFLKENEKKIETVLNECKNNAYEGKRIFDELLSKGVSAFKLARFLGYQGNDYQEYLEELREKTFWSYSLFEKINSAKVFFLGNSEKEVRRSQVDYVLNVNFFSLLFAYFFKLFAFLECYRQKLVSFRQVVKTIFDICDLIVEKYKFSYGATIYVLLELLSVYVANENFSRFAMLYLKQNRQKEVVERVKEWLQSEDRVKKEEEKKEILIFLQLLIASFYEVNRSLTKLFQEGFIVEEEDFQFSIEEGSSLGKVLEKLDMIKQVFSDKNFRQRAIKKILNESNEAERNEVERNEVERNEVEDV